MNHGHVTPNADGSLARCGGPALCDSCAHEDGYLNATAYRDAHNIEHAVTSSPPPFVMRPDCNCAACVYTRAQAAKI